MFIESISALLGNGVRTNRLSKQQEKNIQATNILFSQANLPGTSSLCKQRSNSASSASDGPDINGEKNIGELWRIASLVIGVASFPGDPSPSRAQQGKAECSLLPCLLWALFQRLISDFYCLGREEQGQWHSQGAIQVIWRFHPQHRLIGSPLMNAPSDIAAYKLNKHIRKTW